MLGQNKASLEFCMPANVPTVPTTLSNKFCIINYFKLINITVQININQFCKWMSEKQI